MIGCSAKYTKEKWRRLDYLVSVHSRICFAIITRKPKTGQPWASSCYHYFDFFAGPGYYTANDPVPGLAGEYGSPIRVLNRLRRVMDNLYSKRGLIDREIIAACGDSIGIRLFFIDPREHERLDSCLRGYGLTCHTFSCTCEEAIDAMVQDYGNVEPHDRPYWNDLTDSDPWKPLGLAFFDPNGIPPWDAIRQFATKKRFKYVDLLINIPTTAEKRVRNSPVHVHTGTTTEHLRSLGKKYIYLWQPITSDPWQFALAFCTNFPGGRFPEFPYLGFHAIDSNEGIQIADRFDTTHQERRGRHGKSG